MTRRPAFPEAPSDCHEEGRHSNSQHGNDPTKRTTAATAATAAATATATATVEATTTTKPGSTAERLTLLTLLRNK